MCRLASCAYENSRLDTTIYWFSAADTGKMSRLRSGKRSSWDMPANIKVNGGSQSFNTVNTLRLLGRWMRMFVIPNQVPLLLSQCLKWANQQSSLPLAWKAFTPAGRLMPSSNRDRLVDVCEELVKIGHVLRPHFDLLGDRFSERTEKIAKGRLLTQAEKEAEKDSST